MTTTRTRTPTRTGLPWAVLAVAALAGLALAWWGLSPYSRYLGHTEQPSSVAGQAAAALLFLAGWTLMILAMMLPTATTLLDAVGAAGGRRARVLAAVGFLGVWLAVGYLFRFGDVFVHAAVDSAGWLQARPELVAAAVLALAGGFQLSSLKRRCLAACRSPSSFVYRHWRGRPRTDALRVGAAYGLSCVGCCWALMLVMFGLGTMSVAWMLGVGVVTAVEKNTRFGHRLSAPLGCFLLAAAAWVAMGGPFG